MLIDRTYDARLLNYFFLFSLNFLAGSLKFRSNQLCTLTSSLFIWISDSVAIRSTQFTPVHSPIDPSPSLANKDLFLTILICISFSHWLNQLLLCCLVVAYGALSLIGYQLVSHFLHSNGEKPTSVGMTNSCTSCHPVTSTVQPGKKEHYPASSSNVNC